MYVPPPSHALDEVLSAFEKYLHGRDMLHPLLRAVLIESTGKKRDRAYVYRAYLDRLKVGTELAHPTK